MADLKTTDGVLIVDGSIVFYIDTTKMGDPIQHEVVTLREKYCSLDMIKPLCGKIYSSSAKAKKFKSYYNSKRAENFLKKFQICRGMNYSPRKEV